MARLFRTKKVSKFGLKIGKIDFYAPNPPRNPFYPPMCSYLWLKQRVLGTFTLKKLEVTFFPSQKARSHVFPPLLKNSIKYVPFDLRSLKPKTGTPPNFGCNYRTNMPLFCSVGIRRVWIELEGSNFNWKYF